MDKPTKYGLILISSIFVLLMIPIILDYYSKLYSENSGTLLGSIGTCIGAILTFYLIRYQQNQNKEQSKKIEEQINIAERTNRTNIITAEKSLVYQTHKDAVSAVESKYMGIMTIVSNFKRAYERLESHNTEENSTIFKNTIPSVERLLNIYYNPLKTIESDIDMYDTESRIYLYHILNSNTPQCIETFMDFYKNHVFTGPIQQTEDIIMMHIRIYKTCINLDRLKSICRSSQRTKPNE